MSLGLNAALQRDALSPYLPLLVEAGAAYHLRRRREKRVCRRRRTPTELREELGRTTSLQIEEALKGFSERGTENARRGEVREGGCAVETNTSEIREVLKIEKVGGKKVPYLNSGNL